MKKGFSYVPVMDMLGVITLSFEYTLWDEEEDNICWIMTVTSLFNGNKNSLKII